MKYGLYLQGGLYSEVVFSTGLTVPILTLNLRLTLRSLLANKICWASSTSSHKTACINSYNYKSLRHFKRNHPSYLALHVRIVLQTSLTLSPKKQSCSRRHPSYLALHVCIVLQTSLTLSPKKQSCSRQHLEKS